MGIVKRTKAWQQPTLKITKTAWEKIQLYVNLSFKEVGWLGAVRVDKGDEKKGDTLTIYDVFVPSQEVSGATTDIDASGMEDYSKRLKELGHSDMDMLYWGHSHVNMGTTPSGTDNDTWNEFTEHCEGYFVMSIHNKKGDMYTAIYLGDGWYVSGVDMVIESDEELTNIVKDELQNVRETTYVYSGSATSNGNSTNRQASASASQHSGSGSNRVTSLTTGGKNRNRERNIVGLRQYRSSQHP